MRPIPGGVRQYPMFNAVRLDMQPNGVAIHELAIDGPLSIQPVELEGSDDRGCSRCRWQGVERLRGGICAVIGHRPAAHLELHQEIASPGWQNLGAIALGYSGAAGRKYDGTLPVYLVQPVLEVNGFTRERSEVDDDVHALCHADPDAGNLNGRRQQIAVVGDHPILVRRAQVIQVREEEFKEA